MLRLRDSVFGGALKLTWPLSLSTTGTIQVQKGIHQICLYSGEGFYWVLAYLRGCVNHDCVARIPSLSMRRALYRDTLEETLGFRPTDYICDMYHPNWLGHRYVQLGIGWQWKIDEDENSRQYASQYGERRGTFNFSIRPQCILMGSTGRYMYILHAVREALVKFSKQR